MADLPRIGGNELVTLREACRLFFGGRLSPSALRTEAAKGNLVITQIARKEFVTRHAIEEMIVRCRKPAAHSAPLASENATRTSIAPQAAAGLSAQDALRIKLQTRGSAQ